MHPTTPLPALRQGSKPPIHLRSAPPRQQHNPAHPLSINPYSAPLKLHQQPVHPHPLHPKPPPQTVHLHLALAKSPTTTIRTAKQTRPQNPPNQHKRDPQKTHRTGTHHENQQHRYSNSTRDKTGQPRQNPHNTAHTEQTEHTKKEDSKPS